MGIFLKISITLLKIISMQNLQIKKRLEELNIEEMKINSRLKELARIQGEMLEKLPKHQPKLIEELSEIAAHAILYHRPIDSQRRSRSVAAQMN